MVNYTQDNDYVLNEIVVQVTYESKLDKAIKKALKAAKKNTDEFSTAVKTEPHVRCVFADSGIDLKIRFFCPAREMQKVASKITQDIYNAYNKTKDIEIAYPHMEVMHRKKDS